ncbi:trypsin-like peptidase domain-containing protein [Rhodobacteraceae bacterium DSL-40]|uniref:trypsin-like peptidase domain-containing protein n=1 Tax=Amaricoccus sp. B4 TaxID=3368557 RepID=UPI000DAC8CC3
MPRSLTAGALILCLTALPLQAEKVAPASAAQISLSFAPIVKATAPGVVNIYASRVVAQRVSPFAQDPFFSQLFGGLEKTVPRVQNSLGSGVIVDPAGIVVSNYHVVGDANDIRVVLSDRREFDGEILLADQHADLAIIRLKGASNLPAVELADSDAAEVGDLALAIGNPFGVGQTVTSGIVSGLARSGGGVSDRSGYYIQTDAPINPGNSGGALVDMSGRLLGINTSILSRSGGSNGIGFAIPANLVRQYVEQARSGNSSFRRPWSGITVQQVEASLAQALDQTVPRGVVVANIHPSSPFAAAGLRQGDVITALDGSPVNAPSELDFRLTTRRLGDLADVSFLRNGQEQTTVVSIVEAPDEPPSAPETIQSRNLFDGLTVATLNPRLQETLDLPLSARGVVVTDVEGIAANSGLRRGDILVALNGRELATGRDLARLVRGGPATWDLTLRRRDRTLRVRLRG